MSADEEPRDPGLARERTILAWNRSGLAIIVCIAVVLRHLWPLNGTDESVALGIIAAAAIIWALALLSLYVSRSERSNGVPRGDRVSASLRQGPFSSLSVVSRSRS